MNRATREAIEQDEAVAAAKTKAAKRAKRKRNDVRFALFIQKSIVNLAANGNPNAAEAQRRFWHEAGYIGAPCHKGCRRHKETK